MPVWIGSPSRDATLPKYGLPPVPEQPGSAYSAGTQLTISALDAKAGSEDMRRRARHYRTRLFH